MTAVPGRARNRGPAPECPECGIVGRTAAGPPPAGYRFCISRWITMSVTSTDLLHQTSPWSLALTTTE